MEFQVGNHEPYYHFTIIFFFVLMFCCVKFLLKIFRKTFFFNQRNLKILDLRTNPIKLCNFTYRQLIQLGMTMWLILIESKIESLVKTPLFFSIIGLEKI